MMNTLAFVRRSLLAVRWPHGLMIMTMILVTVALSAMGQPPVSTSPRTPARASNPAINKNTAKPAAKPAWKDLSPVQKNSLEPLSGSWDGMSEARKRKWIAISQNYPSLAPAEQAKLHSRMREWASLSRQQREQARINFAKTAKLSPTEKQSTWQAYQALPPEEKQKLAAKAVPRPTGAAVAVKPVSPQKLAHVPLTRHNTKQAQKPGASGHAPDQNAASPRRGQPATEPAPAAPTQPAQNK
jgi:hypothetical protein